MPDHAVTEEAKQIVIKKTERFMNWCKEVGIEFPKIDYPAFFDGGLVGCKVNAPIQNKEAFLRVPYKALMSVDKAHKDPAMKQFYAENPKIFTKGHRDWEQLTLTVYIIYQKQLGD